MKEFIDYNQSDFAKIKEDLHIREEIEKYTLYWRWFVVGLCLSFLSAFLYLKYTPKQYSASAYIMIKDNMKSGISDELKAVADLGIVGNSSTNNPENEIFIIKSRKIVSKMVDSLNLNISYFEDFETDKVEDYNKNSIKIVFLGKEHLFNSIDTTLLVSYTENNQLYLKDSDGNIIQHSKFNQIITNSKLGDFKILKNESQKTKGKVSIVIKPRRSVISSYTSRIKVTAINNFSSILRLEVIDYNRIKAENILDELIKQYNLDAVNDKNIVTKKTIKFIEKRLKSIGERLALIQNSLKRYKLDYGISGIPNEHIMVLESNLRNDIKNKELATQLSLINWIEEELINQLNGNEILPNNLGFTNEIISENIEEVNRLILRRSELLRFSGGKNPNLLALDKRIKTLKQNLILNLKNLKKSKKIQFNKAKNEKNGTQDQVSSIPLIERDMVDTYRQKNVYSELYSYLLKKKEEISISLAVTVPNAKIIDVAFSSNNPVFPQNKIIYLIAFFTGILVPFSLVFIKLQLDTKIHNRKDIEDNLAISYLGDIPQTNLNDKVIVKDETRTSTAEAFRLLRTNISFMLPKTKVDQIGKTIFLTSTISGEGKSFISLNLASTLALTNKKVLLIGLDLRAPKITDYLKIENSKGVTNYILDENLNFEQIIFTSPEIKNVDFISSGTIPPNPSELLLNPRVENLFNSVKNNYDYIIVDTAPVSLVTDTLLVARFADLFLYVARANYLDKRMLIVPKTLYEEKKLPNMAIVLNGTDSKRGYGYGYGYIEKERKPLYKRFLL